MTRVILIAIILIAMQSIANSQVNRAMELAVLAEAERAFSAYTVKVGFRDGFIKFFADDGIGFGPHPERTREVLQKRPAESGPRRLIFEWTPMFGDISAAVDMGYTTGPVLFTPQGENAKPSFHGIYFSVWQKQADGSWKVAIDMGVDTPSAVAPIDTGFTAAEPVRSGKKEWQHPDSDDYRKLDWALFSSIAKQRPAKGYATHLDKQFRVHRKGLMPITDKAALLPVLRQAKFEFIGGKISRSSDLAFTYGKYTVVNDPANEEAGYYVHVWRRDETGRWKLVADVQNPLPKGESGE